MPPMFPICMSTTTRSGAFSRTERITSAPELSSRIWVSGPAATAAISLRRKAASLATTMVDTPAG